MVTITFSLDIDEGMKQMLINKLSYLCLDQFEQAPIFSKAHVSSSGSVQKRYKCLLCGRDKFTRKSPHKCAGTGGNVRKRGLKWEEVE